MIPIHVRRPRKRESRGNGKDRRTTELLPETNIEDTLKPKDKPILPEFDPELLPTEYENVRAAEARGWVYDAQQRMYLDKSGMPVADSSGRLI